MKKILNVIVLVCCVLFSSAQSQDIQQLILDLEKLAQMRSMLSSMYNGYTTLSNGYSRIVGLSKGSYDLHKNYLDEMLAVNPAVKKYSKIGTVIANQSLIVTESNKAYSGLYKSQLFSLSELVEIKMLFDEINSNCDRQLDELLLVLTPGRMRMSDEERISAVDRIDHDVGALLEKVRSVAKEKQALMAWRGQRRRDVERIKVLNGIKQ